MKGVSNMVASEMSITAVKDSKKTSTTHKHNNRDLTEDEKKLDEYSHINHSRSHDNIQVKKQNIDDAYDEVFGEAVQEYNGKQKRKNRKIKDYRQHIQSSEHKNGALKVQREMIFQFGDKHSFATESEEREWGEVLAEYAKGFEERNPRLHVYNSVVHLDEKTPHLHLNYIPVADGYKNGVERRPALDRALKQQYEDKNKELLANGASADELHDVPASKIYLKWREDEVAVLEQMMNDRGVKRKIVGSNEYKDVNDYKEHKDMQEQAKKELIAKYKQPVINKLTQHPKVVKNAQKNAQTVANKEEREKLEQKQEEAEAMKKEYEAAKEKFAARNAALTEKEKSLFAKEDRMHKQMEKMQALSDSNYKIGLFVSDDSNRIPLSVQRAMAPLFVEGTRADKELREHFRRKDERNAERRRIVQQEHTKSKGLSGP